jgi:hypothetical protein
MVNTQAKYRQFHFTIRTSESVFRKLPRSALQPWVSPSAFYFTASLVQTVVVVSSVIRTFAHASSVPALCGHDANFVFARIQKESLILIVEFIRMPIEPAIEVDRREFVGAYYAQRPEGRLRFREGLQFLPEARHLVLADLHCGRKLLIPGINELQFMLAGSEGIFSRDTEIRRRTQVLTIHEDTCTSRVDVCFEIPDALPEGQWRKNKAA